MLLNVRFGAVLTEEFWVGWCGSVFVYVKESLYHVPWLEGSDSICSCNANSGLTHTETHIHTACIIVILSILTQTRKRSM